jgi:hypothetical protein
MVNIVSQTIAIMGQQLGAQEMARADVVIRPNIGGHRPDRFRAEESGHSRR